MNLGSSFLVLSQGLLPGSLAEYLQVWITCQTVTSDIIALVKIIIGYITDFHVILFHH